MCGQRSKQYIKIGKQKKRKPCPTEAATTALFGTDSLNYTATSFLSYCCRRPRYDFPLTALCTIAGMLSGSRLSHVWYNYWNVKHSCMDTPINRVTRKILRTLRRFSELPRFRDNDDSLTRKDASVHLSLIHI